MHPARNKQQSWWHKKQVLTFLAVSSTQTIFGVRVSESSRLISHWFPYEAHSPEVSIDAKTNYFFVCTKVKDSKSISYF